MLAGRKPASSPGKRSSSRRCGGIRSSGLARGQTDHCGAGGHSARVSSGAWNDIPSQRMIGCRSRNRRAHQEIPRRAPATSRRFGRPNRNRGRQFADRRRLNSRTSLPRKCYASPALVIRQRNSKRRLRQAPAGIPVIARIEDDRLLLRPAHGLSGAGAGAVAILVAALLNYRHTLPMLSFKSPKIVSWMCKAAASAASWLGSDSRAARGICNTESRSCAAITSFAARGA